MNRFIIVLMLVVFTILPLAAGTGDSASVAPAPEKKSQGIPVYYGGTIGLSFGSYFRLSVTPLVGFKLSEKTSAGFKVGYEYVEDKRYDPKLTASNYGASVFARYRAIPNAYLHAEFAYFSYKYKISDFETDRTWVPFIYLGGGYLQPIGPGTALVVEVLVDVLQDSNSPYEAWDPVISIGVAAGF